MIGREMAIALFADLPPTRKREAASAIGHFIAGVLDQESMVGIIEGLCHADEFGPGQKVRSIRGSIHGTITRILEDGRVAVRLDEGGVEILALPENLLPDAEPSHQTKSHQADG